MPELFHSRHPALIVLTLQSIEAEANRRPPGYLEDVLAHGRVNGATVELEEAAYAALLVKYQPQRFRGAGDVVKAITDRLKIRQCPRCQSWQAWLNAHFPLK